jgi:hypothetical protein
MAETSSAMTSGVCSSGNRSDPAARSATAEPSMLQCVAAERQALPARWPNMPDVWAKAAQDVPNSAETALQRGLRRSDTCADYNNSFTQGSDGRKLTDVSESRFAHLQVTALALAR